MAAARYVKLSAEEDERLRGVECNPGLAEKVRLRAKIVRLSHHGMRLEVVAEYSGRSPSISRDLDRWEERGLEGLADGKAPGNKSRIGEEQRIFLREKLAEERTWTAIALAEELLRRFGLRANRESVRVCLLGMGYSWKRNRYVPVKTPDPQLLVESKADLDTLKRGRKKAAWS